MTRLGRALWVVLGIVMVGSAALAPNAAARNLYVTNENSNTVSVIDGNTNQVVGSIPTGPETGPWSVAIAPDGRTAYAANYDSGTIAAIDTATNQVVGPSITIPKSSYGLAITPDGTRAYIANGADDAVTAIDLQARQTIGAPIEACFSPSTVLITPDGSRAYVTCDTAVRVLDLATNTALGAPLPIENTYGGAVTPDGRSVYLADSAGKVVVIDTATNQATPIATGGDPQSVAISPDGTRAYASDYENKGIMVIDTATRQVLNPLFPVAIEAEFLAVSPDGRKVFAGGYNWGVAGLDTATSQPIGPIATGEGVGGLAFVPDQSPAASFAPPVTVRPGVTAVFNGSASSDPDGTVAGFAWQFGDGATGSAVQTTHTYAKPGDYKAVLTVTDNEGCSVAMVFTGQTASCHGSPAASQAQTVEVAYPGVKVKCPKKAGPKGCKFKLKAVEKAGKGKKKKLKAQSGVAKAKVKAGRSAIVSLKPKQKFAKKLAGAKKALVQQSVTIDGETTTKVAKLKIVE